MADEVEIEIRRCGRPTQAGTPCQTLLGIRDMACERHADDRDREFSIHARAVWRTGYEMGRQIGRDEVNSAAQKAARDEHERNLFRTHENGQQIVTTAEGYAYTCRAGVALEIGDEVLLPANPFLAAHWSEVASIGTSYEGRLVEIERYRTPTPGSRRSPR
jgi:hypothetical protein